MKKSISAIVIILLVIIVVYVLMSSQTSNNSISPSISAPPLASATPSISPSSSVSTTPSVGPIKIFNIEGRPFSFSLTQIKVNKGDTVKIIFKNTEGLHDWVLDEFNAKTAKIQSGQTTEVQFVADKKGTFEYYCSVGNHRAQGMKGNLIVE